jgi:hypothetical protein
MQYHAGLAGSLRQFACSRVKLVSALLSLVSVSYLPDDKIALMNIACTNLFSDVSVVPLSQADLDSYSTRLRLDIRVQ